MPPGPKPPEPTRDQALDMVADGRRMIALHRGFLWARHMDLMCDMIEKLVDYAGGELE